MKRLMSVKMMRPQLLLPMVIFYQQWIFVWFYWQEHKSRPHQCPSILNHRSIFLKGCFTLKQQLLKQLRVKLFVEKNKMRSCILICHSFVSTFCCFFLSFLWVKLKCTGWYRLVQVGEGWCRLVQLSTGCAKISTGTAKISTG